MSSNDLENKNWLANSFRNFRKRNDPPVNFVRQSLANITRVARINNFKNIIDKKGPENPAKLKAQK